MAAKPNGYERVREVIIVIAGQAATDYVDALQRNSFHGGEQALQRMTRLRELHNDPETILQLAIQLLGYDESVDA